MAAKQTKRSDTSAHSPMAAPPSRLCAGFMTAFGLAAVVSLILSSWPSSTWLDIASPLQAVGGNDGIRWYPCEDDATFQCGTLSVPLNVGGSFTTLVSRTHIQSARFSLYSISTATTREVSSLRFANSQLQ